MHMHQSQALGLLIVFFVIQLSSCQKLKDKFFPGGSHNGDKKCRIVEIKQDLFGSGELRTGLVYYNKHKDPDSVIFDIATGSAGAHLFYFVYDKQHRLTEYREDYSREPGDYYYKHNYEYWNGRIVTDTVQVREAGSATFISKLKYDSYGRVIREDRTWVLADGEPVNETLDPLIYDYDSDGNLELSGVSYDNRTSFLRTSQLWMFTQRNYSVNNPEGATGYNANGLPAGFDVNAQGDGFLQFGLPVSITYQCK